MLKDKLGIDEKDIALLTMYMKNPSISQTEIAEKLKLSQPSINFRLRKLKQKGVFATSIGIDPKKAGIDLVRVDFTCSDADKILAILKDCPFFVNGFLMSGTRNVSIYLIGEDLNKIEQILKQYLRSNLSVTNIELSVIVNTAKPFISSANLIQEHHNSCSDPKSCEECVLKES